MKKSVTSSADTGQSHDVKHVVCTCTNAYQDKRYKGKRVANPKARKQGHPQEYRCTVCGSIHT